MNQKIPCTVGILTFNSAHTLRRTLESVEDISDIVVCDGGSTDETGAIAQEFGARIILQDARYKNYDGTLKDYGGPRNQCLDAARYDWFLYIDSDETISGGLLDDIRRIVAVPITEQSPLVYRVPIGIIIDGKYIEHSSNYPGYQFRFFNTRSGARFIKPVHERIEFDNTGKIHIGTLMHPWFVHSTRDDWIHYVARAKGRYRTDAITISCTVPFLVYMRYTVWWHLRASFAIIVKSVLNYVRYGFANSIPIRGELGRAAVPLILIWQVTCCRVQRFFGK